MIVFTDSQVRSGHVPREGSHEVAVRLLRQPFVEMYKKLGGTLSAVVLIGSTVRNEANVASDVDILVFLEDGLPGFWSKIGHNQEHVPVLNRIRKELFVPAKIYPVLRSQVLDRGCLRYDKQFLGHAVRSAEQGGLVCGRVGAVEEFWSLAPPITLASTLGYIDTKNGKVNSGLYSFGSLTEEENAALFSDILNGPFHSLRRAFTLCGVKYVDNKSGLINSVLDIGDEKAWTHLRWLRSLGQDYVTYLESKREKVPKAPPSPFLDVERIADEYYQAMDCIRNYVLAAAPPES